MAHALAALALLAALLTPAAAEARSAGYYPEAGHARGCGCARSFGERDSRRDPMLRFLHAGRGRSNW